MIPLNTTSRTTLNAPARLTHLLGLVGLLGSVAMITPGCGDSTTGNTSQQRVVLHSQARIPPEAKTSFNNSYGWSIELSKASLSLGPLYYFEGEPVLVRRHTPHRPLWAEVYDWLIPNAQAHPGHYQSGNAMGQMLDTATVDLLQSPVALPDGDGVTGTYRSATFFFAAGESGRPTIELAGTASNDTDTVQFTGVVQLDELNNYEGKPSVIGCAFEPYADVTGDTTITVTIDPRLWLDQVDFSELSQQGTDSPVEIATGTIAHKALVRGIQKGGGYAFKASDN